MEQADVKEIEGSFTILVQGLNKAQNSGIFTFKDSALILEKIDFFGKLIEEMKKKEELQKQSSQKPSTSKV